MRVFIKAALLAGVAAHGTLVCAQVNEEADADEAGSAIEAAPEQARSLGVVTVTAQRREQSAQDVPIAITAIGGDTMESKGVTSTVDLEQIVPNLQINSAFGSTQPNFSLRGISVANEFNVNQASPVGVYIDDVYLASRTSHGQGLFDLERVEVLRGPQGTLFGRNTTGGAINLITKTPSLSGSEGYAQIGYGSFNTVRAQGAVESTLVEDRVGFRVAANLVKGDGPFENVTPGAKDAGEEDTVQGRASLRLRPGDGDVDIKIRGYYGQSRNTSSPAIGEMAAHDGLDFFEVADNRIGVFDTDAYGIAVNASWDITDALTLVSITSFDGGEQTLEHGADGSPQDLLIVPRTAEYDQWSEELRFNYDGSGFNLIGGVYLGEDEVDVANEYWIGASVAGLPFAVGYDQVYTQTRESTAVFSQADIYLTEKLTLTIGARYTWDDAEYRNGFAQLFAFADDTFDSARTVLATTVSDPNDSTAPYSADGSNEGWTGRLALAYKLDDGTLLYGSYNRGYRAGAFNGGSYTSIAGINYIDPEEVDAYEVGAKGVMADTRYSLAAFYYDYKDQQLTDLQPGPISFLVNAPKSKIMGIELETDTQLTDAIDVSANFAYLDTEYEELSLQGTVLDGNELPFAPEFNASVSANIYLIETATHELVFSPTVYYTASQWFTPFNGIDGSATQVNAELQQDGYTKVNLNLAYTRGPVTLSGFVNNLFEEETYNYGLDLRGAGFPFNLLVQDAPRTYGASLKYSF